MKLLSTFLVSMFIFGCGHEPVSSTSLSESSEVTPQLVKGMNEFSFKLYKELKKSPQLIDKNIFISPASVSLAFGMTYLGAGGDTATEMAQVFGYPDAPALMGHSFKGLTDSLKASKAEDGYDLSISNKIWGQKDFGWTSQFMNDAQTAFDAPLETVDFTSQENHPGIVNAVNDWAANSTKQRIKKVLTKKDVKKDSVILLANAVYFLGDWVFPFTNPGEQINRKENFYRLGAAPVETVFMNHGEAMAGINYYEDERLQAIELPYQAKDRSPDLAMTILLPKNEHDLNSLESSISNEKLNSIVSSMQMSGRESGFNLLVSLPKWEQKSEVLKLKEPIQNLGLEKAFSPYNRFTGEGADFSRMNNRRDITLDKVLHKTFIKVDEKGTEAAAVTVIGGIRATSFEPILTTKEFKANRPFIYVIRNVKTGSVLFMGRLLDPSN